MMNKVTIYEVGPRDGLQNEAEFVATDIKVELINKLSASGLRKIEVTSFVSSKWVPQMADSKDVFENIDRKGGVTYAALTPNEQGMIAALNAGADEVAIFASASESFSQKNINCSIEESLERFKPVVEIAKEKNIAVRGYVSCVTHCPYDGEIDARKTAKVSEALIEIGCYQISLGDTIGRATPDDIQRLLKAHLTVLPSEVLALHCHDTFGHALSNIKVGMELDIDTFDSSVAGLGGCPYADGASGNVATEAVNRMVNDLGIATGIDTQKLNDAVVYINRILNRE